MCSRSGSEIEEEEKEQHLKIHQFEEKEEEEDFPTAKDVADNIARTNKV